MRWRGVPDFPDHEISECGDLRRVSSGKILKGGWNKKGYRRYRLSRDGSQFDVFAHRLVLAGFVGPKPFHEAVGCHNDGNSRNNHISNLRWDTPRSNFDDTIAHGSLRGARNGNSILDDAKVIQIRTRIARGEPSRSIATSFGVCSRMIRHIGNRTKWAHVA